ncbi:hypothetical protein B1812_12835 [Methylocystis bryophila]|uniref:Uncharacterized protein n=1 Tax=Methylocystis bryophila TaxID=655015 RepID=A0A1W6MW36_9HYPH|nr:hypothetical protein B1812_12835 [Methylocystis bryophila]
MVEFFGRQEFKRWQVGFKLRSQLVIRQHRRRHDERIVIDDYLDTLGSSLDAHRESEAVPLPHDFAFDSLKWHWTCSYSPKRAPSTFQMRPDDDSVTGAGIGRRGETCLGLCGAPMAAITQQYIAASAKPRISAAGVGDQHDP